MSPVSLIRVLTKRIYIAVSQGGVQVIKLPKKESLVQVWP